MGLGDLVNDDMVEFLAQTLTLVLPDKATNSVYAAVGHGHFGVKMHRSSDGGRTYEEVASPAYPERPEGVDPEVDWMGRPVPDSLQMVWSLETGGPDRGETIWCGTIPGALFRSTDRGHSWEMMHTLWNDLLRKKWVGGGADWPGIHSVCVDPRSSDTVRIGISCGGVWQTDDNGKAWACRAQGMRADYLPPEQANDPNAQDPHRVVQCPTQPDWLYAQHHNGIFISDDGSATWREAQNVSPAPFGFAVVVHPDDGKTAWFVPGHSDMQRIPVDGKLVVNRTRDGGQTFETFARGLPQEHAYDIVFRHCLDIDAAGKTLAFGTTTGALYISEDQGESWEEISANLPPIYCVRFEK